MILENITFCSSKSLKTGCCKYFAVSLLENLCFRRQSFLSDLLDSLSRKIFLDFSVSAQILATNNRFCSLEHRYRRKNWWREITEFCVVKISFENFFKILQDHRFLQILRSWNHCQRVQTTALLSPPGCLESLCLFWSETDFVSLSDMNSLS